jgi:site-specific recombinase XerD
MNRVTVAQPIIRTRQLTVEELKTIAFPIQIQGNLVIIDKGVTGHKIKTPVALELEKVLEVKEKGLIDYILASFVSQRPALIPFVFHNQSLIRMARHFLRHCSGSHGSCCNYTAHMQRYANWLGYTPDAIIQDIKTIGNIPDLQRVQNHTGFLNDYLAELQDEGISPGPVNNYIKSVKTFYRVNGIKIELSEPLSRRVKYKDRAPTPEEMTKLLDIGTLRERVIISMTGLGGFREGTLSKLKYRHVKEDLEARRIPLHIHVEAEITKGKYGDYDTFLGPEAVTFLELYLDARRKGTRYIPPETITDESPLLRDERVAKVKGIKGSAIRDIVHKLYKAAGLLKKTLGRLYDLREHSIRKFFKTQMISLGVQSDYVDYMMGHKVDTYNDIQSKGIEFLRNIYRAAGLTIRAKMKVSKLDALKEIIRAWGMNPEEVLTRNALVEGNITKQGDVTDYQLAVLGQELKRLIKAEATV